MPHPDIVAVLEGRAKWGVIVSKAEDFYGDLPDDCIDMAVFSPPYLKAREYGELKFKMNAEEWSAWMLSLVRIMQPKVKGPIFINCEGQTEDYAFQPGPALLEADLYRAGFTTRKTLAFERDGIPGSGGPDFLKNNWEPVICVTRPGKLPFSDVLACGHKPKWAPGGEMSHRLTNGTRVNKKSALGIQIDRPVGSRANTGAKKDPTKEKYRAKPNFRHSEDGSVKGAHEHDICDIANPTNVVKWFEELEYAERQIAALRQFIESNGLTLPEDNPGNVLQFPVGGNLMGHPLAHKNEAPYPLGLPRALIRMFCPPGGRVSDPFAGSGTTPHAAYEQGMEFIGCDLRPCQVQITKDRLRSVTPFLFEIFDDSVEVLPEAKAPAAVTPSMF